MHRALVVLCALSFPAAGNAQTFYIGESVITNSVSVVKQRPSLGSRVLCNQPSGVPGVITKGPVLEKAAIPPLYWWKVEFSSGCDGWVYDISLTAE